MRRFTKKDIPTINAWYQARKLPPLHPELYPDIGYIVENVAAGFIYQTDSVLCFIEGYIANPQTSKEERKAAFDEITTALIRTAKDHGFKSILAYSQLEEIRKRCERYDFKFKGHYALYVKEI